MNNLQVELIRCRKNVDLIHVYFCEATNSMQYRRTKTNQYVSNFGKPLCIVNIRKVYIERKN